MTDAPAMDDPSAFTDGENWSGGFYELAIELGHTSDQRLQRALSTLWRAAAIQGCYGRRDREPGEQDVIACTVASLGEFGLLRGTVRLPAGPRIVCGCVAVREDGGPDWLDFFLPMGALARVDRRVGGFPFGRDGSPASLEWRRPIDDWLATIAHAIFGVVGFRLGLIGFEQSGMTSAAELHGRVPAERWAGYLLPADGLPRYEPANR